MTTPETDSTPAEPTADEPPPEPEVVKRGATQRGRARRHLARPPGAGPSRKARHGLALAGLAAAWTALPVAGQVGADGDAAAEGVDQTLSWVLFGGATAGLTIAALGAVAAAALLTYSPTRLTRLSGGEELRDRLEDEALELQLAARTQTLLGLMAATLCTWIGTAPAVWVPLITLGLLTILLCGVVPTRLAEVRAEAIVAWAVPLLRPLRALLRFPLLMPLNAVTGGVLRVFRLTDPNAGGEPEMVADEILTAVSDSAHEAELPDEERHWIENIVELKSLHASGVMTPRPDVVALHRALPITEAIARAVETGHSRYPVFGDSSDHVVGVFYAKDALRLLLDEASEARGEVVVGELMREESVVPESMPLDELLRHFRSTKRQLAIVKDEYGGTSGIVTLEDVLEEIVGDIEDEHDPEAELWVHVLEEGRSLEAAGRARIDEINEHLADRLPEDDHYDTIGGWVFTRLGRVPTVGESVEVDGLRIDILQADERRIARLRVSVDAADGPTADGDGQPPQ